MANQANPVAGKGVVLPKQQTAGKPVYAGTVASPAPAAPARQVQVKAHTRTIRPKPAKTGLPPTNDKPAVKPPAQPPPSYRGLLLYPGQNPQQLAQAALAPQYQQVAQQQQADQAALKSFTQAILGQLGQYPGQVGQQYDQAANQINDYASQAAKMVAALNPSAANNSLLSAAGAPAAQQTLEGANLERLFGGAGAQLYTANGALPASTLQAEKAAAQSYASALPGIEGLAGTQALRNLLFQGGQQRAQIAAQLPGLANQYATAQADSAAKAAALDQNAQALGIKTSQQQFDNQVTLSKLSLQQQTADYRRAATAAGAKAAAGKISPAVSKVLGYVATANGTPITTKDGKVIPINPATGKSGVPKVPTATQLTKLVQQWHDGTSRNVHVRAKDKSGQPAFNPSTGAPVYNTVTKQGAGRVGYMQAYKRLRAMSIDDQTARNYLNGVYRRGELGRGWLTNDQQAALRKAGRQPAVGYFRKNPYITAGQLVTLAKAGLKPQGEPGVVNGKPVFYIAPGY